MKIEQVTEVSDELVAAMQQLIPQLSPTNVPPTLDELAELIANTNTFLYIARDEQNKIVGTLTLALYRTPTAFHAWIEDVVVDKATRGKGIGSALTKAGIQQAATLGCKRVNLTSRPAREAANRLYQHLGFTHWETNAYWYALPHQSEQDKVK